MYIKSLSTKSNKAHGLSSRYAVFLGCIFPIPLCSITLDYRPAEWSFFCYAGSHVLVNGDTAFKNLLAARTFTLLHRSRLLRNDVLLFGEKS